MRACTHPVALIVAVSCLAGWGGYRWGRCPDPGLQVWAGRAKGNPTKSHSTRDSQREHGTDAIRKLLREDPTQRDDVRQWEAWEQVRAFSIGQIKEALALTGEKISSIGHNIPAEMLFYRWGELDPQEAMRHARQLPERDQYLASNVLVAWMKNDPESAYRWSLGARDFAKKLRIDDMIASTLTAESAASAMEKSLLMGDGVSAMIANKFARTMAADPESRAAFLSAVSNLEEKDRNDGIEGMMRTWANKAPEEVLGGLKSLPIDDGKKQELLGKILNQWGRKDPAKALSWLDDHPDPANSSRQLDIYQLWIADDAPAAGRWLQTQSDPAAIAAEMVRQLHSNSLNNTMSHIFWERVKQQHENIRQNYQIWAKFRPDEAGRWLESTAPDFANSITGGTDEKH